MAYDGYLIKLGSSSGATLPMECIRLESYQCTPDQRMEAKADRSITGVLQRTTVEHTATKIEFETPVITNSQLETLMSSIRSSFTNQLERRLNIYYYDMETNSYKLADVYMPDTQYTINRIDKDKKIIYYNPVRIAFIEY